MREGEREGKAREGMRGRGKEGGKNMSVYVYMYKL